MSEAMTLPQDATDEVKLARERRNQFRLVRMQLWNWGTFSNLHTIPISPEGHLVLGPSGSGKSTILDGKTALLAPNMWMEFNAAAREGNKRERDRNLVTYVRGAWSRTENDEGAAALEVLRKGSTWSALSMTLATEAGECVTLAQLYWIRGSSMDSKSVQKHFLVVERDLQLSELEFFGKEDFNIRKLKQTVEAAYSDSTAAGYTDTFRAKLGIPSEQALKLLHKAQSTKNISDLGSFMRELMLDKPTTFDYAKELVHQFVNLNEAHSAVVKARRQIEVLAPARAAYTDRLAVEGQLIHLRDLDLVLPHYVGMRRDDLLVKAIAFSFEEQRRLEDLAVSARTRAVEASELEGQLRLAVWKAGGGALDDLHNELADLGRQLTAKLSKYEQVAKAYGQLGQQVPGDADAYATSQSNARGQCEAMQSGSDQDGDKLARKLNEAKVLTDLIQEYEGELAAMASKPSNIPKALRDLRTVMSIALKIPEEDLPYAGELMEVYENEKAWQPALERLLGNLSTSMLVPEKHYDHVLRLVNEQNLKRYFAYHRVSDATQAKERQDLGPKAAARKLRLKEHECRGWLEAELRSRFNHTCTDDLREFRQEKYALTSAGQIRGGRSLHIKDDGHNISDDSRWSLGWDNTARKRSFQKRLDKARDDLTAVDAAINLQRQINQKALRSVASLTLISSTGWTEIDAQGCRRRQGEVAAAIKKLEQDDPELSALNKQFEHQKGVADRAGKEATKAELEVTQEADRRKKWQTALDGLRSGTTFLQPSPLQIEGLEARFEATGRAVQLDTLDSVNGEVQRTLGTDIGKLTTRSSELKAQVERAFHAFKVTPGWEMDASDMDSTIGSADAYISLLEGLERDRLPEFEQRFFDFLKDQSDQHLANLIAQLNTEAKQIEDRIDSVNAALKHAPFNKDTYLQLESVPINQKAVQDFKKEIKEAFSHVLNSEDRASAEARFLLLQRLVERFSSSKSEDERWRNLVLDVRQHVEFRARELGGQTGKGEIYEGGGGRSGGQRQKLTTTCLAAALRFQLVDDEQLIPRFAPVVIDEAFDKADHAFTSMAIGIFQKFGFQIIVATPMKAVTTFEPFIGGATLVNIQDRKHSAARHLTVREVMDVARSSRAANDPS